jgi:site-specific DNA recombinase
MKNVLEIFSPFAKGSKLIEKIEGANCVIYNRVSSEEQSKGYSLGIQDDTNTKYTEQFKINVLGRFGGEYESAKTDERLEFNKMLNFIRKSKVKVSFIIVHYPDRFSRSGANAIYIANELRKEGIKIISTTNPVDTNTSTGKFQQNLQFLLAELDNDQRKERTGSGLLRFVKEGYWPAHAPTGYTIIKKNKEKSIPQKIFVNETGKLLRKAFYWKAEGIYSNIEIIEKLNKLGLIIKPQVLSTIFKNPFYCGLISHNMLKGEVVEGKHEKLISKELFLKINNTPTKNPKGKHATEFDEISLKVFVKCGCCGTPFAGYLVRARGIWYYKCNKIGCKLNRNADELNERFEEMLSHFYIPEKFVEPIKDEFRKRVLNGEKDNEETEQILKTRLAEIESKIIVLNEKYLFDKTGSVEPELYAQYKGELVGEKKRIQTEIENLSLNLSNIESGINKYCNLVMKVPHLWRDSDYKGKLELQNILFPQGIFYYREIDDYRTKEINSVTLKLASLSVGLGNKKSGLSNYLLEKSASVAGG